jgi:hypothetical protein
VDEITDGMTRCIDGIMGAVSDNCPREFEGHLSGAVFWGADLSGATFRDVNLTGVSFSHVWFVGVEVDGLVDRLVVNGVDVTGYVNERDPWYPLRTSLRPSDPGGMVAAWTSLDAAWEVTIDRARALPDDRVTESVAGEWSFVDTLRHLVFANDKWFGLPLAGDTAFHPLGLPNSESADRDWPGLDRAAAPSFDEVIAVRSQSGERFAAYLRHVDDADLDRDADVVENGVHPVRECVYTIFEEEFEHLRYARRDLTALGAVFD